MRHCQLISPMFVATLAVLTALLGTPASPRCETSAAAPLAQPTPTTQSNHGTWQFLGPPHRRYGHSAVYDAEHDRMVIFGGHVEGTNYFNDVWAIETSGLEDWTPLITVGPRPIGRVGHTAIVDPARGRMVVYGGRGYSGVYDGPFGDVWTLSLRSPSWQMILAADSLPSARSYHTAIHDPVRDRMIVYGGLDSTDILGDLWALSLGDMVWSRLSPTGDLPGPNLGHRAIYDPIRDRMVVFGGIDSLDFSDRTWALDLATLTWTEVMHGGPSTPGISFTHGAAYDPVRDAMLIFTGDELWQLPFDPPGIWSQVMSPLPGVYTRTQTSFIYDSSRDRAAIFGGRTAHAKPPFDDAWAVSLADAPFTTWSRLPSVPYLTPDPALYIPSRDWLVITGRQHYLKPLGSPTAWTTLGGAGTPPSPRTNAALTYDHSRDRMVVFGGSAFSGGGRLNDTWVLEFSGVLAWNSMLTTGAPAARGGHSAVYDGLRDRLIVFGGHDGAIDLDDTWALDFATLQWTEILPAGGRPAARSGHGAVYDAVRDRMIVYGGSGLNDVWELSFSGGPAWQEIVATGSPPTPGSPILVFHDTVDDRLITYHGFNFWALDLQGAPVWNVQATSGAPPSGDFVIAAYDSRRDRVLAYVKWIPGGHTNPDEREFHALSWDRLVSVPEQPRADLWLAPPFPNPSRGAATVRFGLPAAGVVRLRMYDIGGRVVATLVDGPLAAGVHSVPLATTLRSSIAPGVYLWDFRTPFGRVSRRSVFIR